MEHTIFSANGIKGQLLWRSRSYSSYDCNCAPAKNTNANIGIRRIIVAHITCLGRKHGLLIQDTLTRKMYLPSFVRMKYGHKMTKGID